MSSLPDTESRLVTSVLTDAQVIDEVDRSRAIDALRSVLVSAHRGSARSIPKTMAHIDSSSTAHSLGAVDLDRQIVAFKNWVNTPKGASALVSLFDATTGRTLAVMSAGALGMLRTAGTAALATDLLAAPSATDMAILGTGRQAFHQVAAVATVRHLSRVRVWSPTERSRVDFAARVSSELGVRTEPCDSAREAVAAAEIVTTVTRARDPFLDGDWLDNGAHLNAVGAILPSSAELLPSVLSLSDVTAVDDIENAARGSRELRAHFGDDLDGVISLGGIIDRGITRPDNPRLTVYKGMGSGLTDLALAALVWSNSASTHDSKGT